MKMIHMTCPDHPEATLEGYILDCELSLGQEKNRPAVVICPGGGYLYCSPREAEQVHRHRLINTTQVPNAFERSNDLCYLP